MKRGEVYGPAVLAVLTGWAVAAVAVVIAWPWIKVQLTDAAKGAARSALSDWKALIP